jgi:hypothetical protein
VAAMLFFTWSFVLENDLAVIKCLFFPSSLEAEPSGH